MLYWPNIPDQYRRVGSYVDKILRGARPADLLIEQPTQFEFVVNLSTAKALGITIPESILLRADEVIRRARHQRSRACGWRIPTQAAIGV
jgi:putative ABC transport system substrate-binding protein